MTNSSNVSERSGLLKILQPPKPVKELKRLLTFGDVHLLHRRVPTWHIVDVCKEMVSKCGDTLAAIYVNGDMFEDSRYLRQDESHEAIEFLIWLLNWCKQTNTALRVLEGTPSHDHGQSKVMEKLNTSIGADFIYLSGIGIFYDSALGGHVGWVSDEYGDKVAEHTEQVMAELMATHGLEKLDFFFMHGVFKFQLPIESPITFNEDFWISRCRLGIYINHDHREKQFSIIRVPGSVDRLAHGEEEDKGMTLVDFSPTLATNYFYVNERACPQLHVNVNEDYDAHYAACLKALEYVDNHPSSSVGRVKIEYHPGSPIAEHIVRWKKEYSFHIEGKRTRSQEETEQLEAVFKIDVVMEENITADNVEGLMFSALEGESYNPTIVSEIVRSLK